jgi:hypothetical protein
MASNFKNTINIAKSSLLKILNQNYVQKTRN